MSLCCFGGSLPFKTVTAYRYRFMVEPSNSSMEHSFIGFMVCIPRQACFLENTPDRESPEDSES